MKDTPTRRIASQRLRHRRPTRFEAPYTGRFVVIRGWCAGCPGVARHRSAVYPPARTTKPTSRPTRTQVPLWAPSCDRSCDRSCDSSGDSSMLIMPPLLLEPHCHPIHLSLCIYRHRNTLVSLYILTYPYTSLCYITSLGNI